MLMLIVYFVYNILLFVHSFQFISFHLFHYISLIMYSLGTDVTVQVIIG